MNRLRTYFLISAIAFLFSSCEEDGAKPENIFHVSDFSTIQIGGEARVEIQPAAPGNKTIRIEGDPALVSEFQIRSEDGVLHIQATENVTMSNNMRVIAPVSTLTRIVLEADEEAQVLWDEEDEDSALEQLDIKLEANSLLGLLGLRIRNINIQQEAQSRLYLNSSSAGELADILVEKEDISFVNDTTAIVAGERLVYFESFQEVTTEGVEYYVLTGDDLRSLFIVQRVETTLQATSEMRADDAPVRHYDIHLEGQSTAHIWAVETLSGKGEGSSVLSYFGDPVVNYPTEGTAQVVRLQSE